MTQFNQLKFNAMHRDEKALRHRVDGGCVSTAHTGRRADLKSGVYRPERELVLSFLAAVIEPGDGQGRHGLGQFDGAREVDGLSPRHQQPLLGDARVANARRRVGHVLQQSASR